MIKKSQYKLLLIYSILFAIVGFVVGIYVSDLGSRSYENFYFYSSIAGFFTAWIFSYYWIIKPQIYTISRFLSIASFVGIVSHWLCWYLLLILNNFRSLVLNDPSFYNSPNIFIGFFTSFVASFFSLIFFGWATILGSILALYGTKVILDKIDPNWKVYY